MSLHFLAWLVATQLENKFYVLKRLPDIIATYLSTLQYQGHPMTIRSHMIIMYHKF